MKNFLIKQYQKDVKFKISHNYLPSQFENHKEILIKIEKLLKNCDFTLGEEVSNLENKFKKIAKTKYAFGVGSGTDALFLSLKALNLSPGDEVITPSFTFYATVGAIGNTPRFLGGCSLMCVRRCPTFPPFWVVSSALAGLASGFGMGPGVSLPLWPP